MTEQEKRTKELLSSNRPGEKANYADVQALQNQIQAINFERAQNIAMARQETQANAQVAQVANDAGQALLVGSGGVGAGTGATLAKYGMPIRQTITKQETKTVKQGPTNIHITNNNITTNNNVGIPQGREIAFRQPQQAVEQAQQGKFKQWVTSVFNRQREENSKRESQYERREWSLSKQVNKLVRRMEDTGRTVMDNLNPQKFASSVGSQMKTMLFLFGIQFLASNFTKVLKVTHKVSNFLEKTLDWFGITERGRKLNNQGSAGSFRGDLYYFFTGSYPRNGETIMSLFEKLFKDLVKHISTWFEWQMERRGVAIRQVKFPKLDIGQSKDTGNSTMNSVLAGLGDILTKTFSGITTYLGDILTAIVSPGAGIKRVAETNVKQEGLKSSQKAAMRRGEPNTFDNSEINSNVNNGDYSLVTKSSSGKRKYSLNLNALDTNGNLITGEGSVGAQVSQGRDILGAYNDAKDYGVINTGRLLSGLQRLYESSKSQGSVVVDAEFMQKMFGTTNVPGVQPVRMKFVEADMTSRDKAQERIYAHNKYGATDWYDGILTLGKATFGVVPQLTYDAATKGLVEGAKSTAKRIISAPGKSVVDTINGIRAEGEYRDKKYILVPENDPRPAAIGGTRTFFSLKPEALEHLASTKYNVKSFDKDNYEVLLSSAKNSLLERGGGVTQVNKQWRLVGKQSGYFDRQQDFKTESFRKDLNDLKMIDDRYTNLLSTDEFSKTKNSVKKNLKIAANNIIDFGNDAIDYINGAISPVKPIPLTKGQQSRIATYVMNRLMKEAGLTKEQAAGVVGNLLAESGLNPTSYNPNDNGGPSGGIAQWHDTSPGVGRLSNLKKYATSKGKPWTDLDTQIDFLIYEDKGSLDALKAIRNSEANLAKSSFLWGYTAEKFQGYKNSNHQEYRRRQGFALGAFKGFSENATYTSAQLSFPLASGDDGMQPQISPYYAGSGDLGGVGARVCGSASNAKSSIREWLWGGKDYPTIFSGRGSAAERRMSTLIVDITVPCRDTEGKQYYHSLKIHKFLAQDVQNIFREIFETTPFRVVPGSLGGYCYRAASTGKGSNPEKKLSNHAFGSAIDINPKYNGIGAKDGSDDNFRLRTTSHPVVKIFNHHGWTWGGIWNTSDPMHFEFANGEKMLQEGLVGSGQGELVKGTFTSTSSMSGVVGEKQEYSAVLSSGGKLDITAGVSKVGISLSSVSGEGFSAHTANTYSNYIAGGGVTTTYTSYSGSTMSGSGNEACAIVGDSWSVGLKSYFPKHFGYSGIQIINPRGKHGDGRKYMQEAVSANSNPIVLIIGLNSASLGLDTLIKQFTILANIAKTAGKELYICTYPFVDESKRPDLNKNIPKLNRAISTICNQGLGHLIDIEPYRYVTNYSKDGYHLDSQGWKMLADEIKDKMAGRRATLQKGIETSGGHLDYSGDLSNGYSSSVSDEFYGTGGFSIPNIPEDWKFETGTEPTPEILDRMRQAGEIWQIHGGKIISSSGKGYYKSLSDFAIDFAKLGDSDRADIISRARGLKEGKSAWSKLNNYDKIVGLRDSKSYLRSESDFADWYSGLTDERRRGVDYFLNYRNAITSDKQFRAWLKMAKENGTLSKFLNSDEFSHNKLTITGIKRVLDEERLRTWYDKVANGDIINAKGLEGEAASSVLFRDDYGKLSDEISDLEGRLKHLPKADERGRSFVQKELDFKKMKLRSLRGLNKSYNSHVTSGDSMDKKGLYLRNDHRSRAKLDRLNEIAFEKKHLKEKYERLKEEAIWNGDLFIEDSVWAKRYKEELESLNREESTLNSELDKLAEKTGKNVKELRKKREQMQRYIMDGKEGVMSAFDDALSSGKSFLESIQEAVKKYGEEVALELARAKTGFDDLTRLDLDPNYRRSDVSSKGMGANINEYTRNPGGTAVTALSLTGNAVQLEKNIKYDEALGKKVPKETKQAAKLMSNPLASSSYLKDVATVRKYIVNELKKGRYHFSVAAADGKGTKMTKEEAFSDIARELGTNTSTLSQIVAGSSNNIIEGLAVLANKVDNLNKGVTSHLSSLPAISTNSSSRSLYQSYTKP